MKRAALVGIAMTLSIAALLPAPARAQSAAVREGQRLFEEAEFEQAIEVLERGLDTETLTRAEVSIALDRLAIAHHALGHGAAVERALRWLAIVDRDHRFGPDAPPELAALAAIAIDRASTELMISVVDEEDDRVTIEASFAGADDLRAIQLTCRAPGEGERALRDRRPRLTVARAASCDAIAIGPGAFPVATTHRDGTRDDGVSPPGAAGIADEVWIGLGAGGGALVIGAIVIGVILGLPATGPVQLSAPSVPAWSP